MRLRVVSTCHMFLDTSESRYRETFGHPVMYKREEMEESVALDLIFCVSTEWEVVFLGGTTLAKVILVKGHELPTIVKVLPVGFHFKVILSYT
ncbi:hypothetical protein Tco_0011547 [Tanacetum coccineum]